MAGRREFLKKLGIGTFVMGGAGVFTLQKPALLVPESASGPEIKIVSEQTLDLKYTNEEEFSVLCSNIFNAIDGKSTDPMIYDVVSKMLKKGTYLEEENKRDEYYKELSEVYRRASLQKRSTQNGKRPTR